METILNYDCFPAGMEMFPAMDEEIFKYIKRIIDDSDYYLLIIGGRYGSMSDDGVSWTEKEYDYAVSKGIPVIAFDHKDFTQLPANKTDQDNKKRKKLIAFKKKVSTGRLIKKWSNKDDLALAVATSLKSVLELQPRIGWIRANSIFGSDAQTETERLKKEILDRENEVKRLKMVVKGLEMELKKKDAGYPENKSIIIPGTGISFKMIHVDGGTFMMGANKGDKNAYPDEKPAHEVKLSEYWIGETQVTQALWEAVMGENPSKFKGNPNLPVECVSWEDCKEFIRLLNKLTGKKFRLPTEAQWEFAARGGNFGKDTRYLYAGSNDANDIAWFEENSMMKTHPVGQKIPNELGIYDMSGNVWEWCNDWYDNNYSNSPTHDPMGSDYGTHNVVRGGSWGDNAAGCRVSCRLINRPTFRGSNLGLRLAL